MRPGHTLSPPPERPHRQEVDGGGDGHDTVLGGGDVHLRLRPVQAFIFIFIFKRSFLVAVIDIVPYTSADCRDFAMIAPRWTDTTTYYLPEAVGFLGVWSTTMYELMVWISIHALRTGKAASPPPASEPFTYSTCTASGPG